MIDSLNNRYSADVKLSLLIGDESLQLAKVGPDSLTLRQPRDLPPGTAAKIVVRVDDRETVYSAILQGGASTDRIRVEFFF